MLECNAQLNAQQLTDLKNLKMLCEQEDKGSVALYFHVLQQKRDQECNYLLYDERRNLLAFLSIYFFYEEACEISLLVTPEKRKQGLAKQLLQQAISLLQKKQIKQIIFSLPGNTDPSWLKSRGFHYQQSDYLMQRKSFAPQLVVAAKLDISLALHEDCPLLSQLDKACFPESSPNNNAHFANLLTKDNYALLIAKYQGKAIGKAHVRWEGKKAIFSDIAVFPDYQGQGFGGEILSYCINFSLMQGYSLLELEVSSQNQSALNLYLRHGFQVIQQYDYYGLSLSRLVAL